MTGVYFIILNRYTVTMVTYLTSCNRKKKQCKAKVDLSGSGQVLLKDGELLD
jgi:hypothetical protein